ncbi:MAG: AAA family ATPase [Vicinamibacterales bacterium]
MMAPDAWDGADVVRDLSECPACGRESCEGGCLPDDEHTGAAPTPGGSPPAHRFQRAADVLLTPPPLAILEGLLYADRLTVLVAESGAGKTFVALDLTAAIADGLLSWHGRRVTAGSVGYVSFEGDALNLRLAALKTKGHRLDHAYILRAEDALSPLIERDRTELPSRGELVLRADLEGLQTDIASQGGPPIRAVVIDTVRASLSGSEDNSESISAYLRACRRVLAVCPGAALLLVHHAGWQDGETQKKRERGSSALRGNVDATVFLSCDDADDRGDVRLTLSTLKVRDVERPAPLALVRRRVQLDTQDSYGHPHTSCIIDRDPRTYADRQAEQRRVLDAALADLDRRILRAVARQPLSSQDAIRVAAGANRTETYAAIARLCARGHLLPPARKQHPFTLSPEGLATLEGGIS